MIIWTIYWEKTLISVDLDKFRQEKKPLSFDHLLILIESIEFNAFF